MGSNFFKKEKPYESEQILELVNRLTDRALASAPETQNANTDGLRNRLFNGEKSNKASDGRAVARQHWQQQSQSDQFKLEQINNYMASSVKEKALRQFIIANHAQQNPRQYDSLYRPAASEASLPYSRNNELETIKEELIAQELALPALATEEQPALTAAPAQSDAVNMRAMIASYPTTPTAAMLILMEDEEAAVRLALTTNPNVPAAILEELCRDVDLNVRRQAQRLLQDKWSTADQTHDRIPAIQVGEQHYRQAS